jgi:hypothetical protein
MKTALVIEDSARCPLAWISCQLCPFFSTTRAATIADNTNAT